MRLWIIAAALACSTAAQAATVVKCVDASGKVAFSQNECPPGTTGAELKVEAAPRPSGDGADVRLADPSKSFAPPKPKVVRHIAAPQAEEPKVVYREVEKQVPVYIKPCVKYIEQKIHTRQKMADGSTRGGVEIRKVPVPCNTK